MSHLTADAHIHLFRDGGEPQVAHYERLRSTYGMDAALVVAFEGAPRYAGNSPYVLELARTREWMRPLLYVDPNSAPTERELESALAAGYSGVAVYANKPDDRWLPWALASARSLAGSLISINSTPQALATIRPMVADLDESAVLVSHLGNPGRALDAGVPLETALASLIGLADLPHVFVKMSGLYDIDPIYPHTLARDAVARAVDAFGASRLVWGSDFPVVFSALTEHDTFTLPEWVHSLLTPDELDLVRGGTLLSILRAASPRRS